MSVMCWGKCDMYVGGSKKLIVACCSSCVMQVMPDISGK